MIIALTGGTGYIGRHLVSSLLNNGHHVRLLTRNSNIEYSNNLVPYEGDLRNLQSLNFFTKNVDILFHCAAEIRNPRKMYQINVEGTSNLIEAARGNIRRWVQLSSVGVYGKYQFGNIIETSDLNPVNDYEKSKAQSDFLVQRAAASGYFECTLLRPSTVFSSDMPSTFLLQLVSMIKKNFFFILVNLVHQLIISMLKM